MTKDSVNLCNSKLNEQNLAFSNQCVVKLKAMGWRTGIWSAE